MSATEHTSTMIEVAHATPSAVGFPVNVPPWALDLVGQLQPALVAAKLIIAAGMAPRGYDKPEQIVVACAMGARLGLDPFASMAGISVINNRPTVWGDTMLAVCQNHSAWGGMKTERTGDGDAFSVRVTVNRKGVEPSVSEFSMSDAAKAGLKGKQGPWTNYPKRMVEMRARAFALRTAFADALAGFHAREEMDDEPVDVTASASVRAEPKPAKRRTVAEPTETHSGVTSQGTTSTAGRVTAEEKAEDEAELATVAEESKTLGEQVAEAQPATVERCTVEFAKLWRHSDEGKAIAKEVQAAWKLAKIADLAGASDDDREAFLVEVGEALAKLEG